MSKGQKNSNNKKSIIGVIINSVLSILLIVALLVGNMYSTLISNILNSPTTKIINPVEDVYISDFENYEDLVKYEEEIGRQAEAEGIVLLKNENNVLPFSDEIKKISVFGQDSVDFVYGGSGSGSVSANKTISLKTSLESSGFELNRELWDFYSTGAGSSYRKEYMDVTGQGSFAVNEVPAYIYTDDIIKSYSEYSDAAIIVLGRSGGESADLPTEILPTGSRYLQLDKNEEDLIEMVTEAFDNVIVIINSSNPMELGFLSNSEIDASFWVGAVGQTGIYAIGDVLKGEVNPSGKLVDTYAYDSTSAPSFENLGRYKIINDGLGGEDKNDKYLVYGEGIYVGYRYYETRYEDVILDSKGVGNYDYSSTVQFPFGYGLSYTSFEYSNYLVSENEDSFEISVDVKNSGNFAGKNVVQIYMQSPYTEYNKQNNIEKSSIELVGFEKTEILEPGQSETVKVLVSKEQIKTYDAYGLKTYIVDAGDYYFAFGQNAHDALNNILTAKGYSTENGMSSNGDSQFVSKYVVENQDNTIYSTSSVTNYAITNQFDDVDIKYYDNNYQYLSRNSWTETWPNTYKNGSWLAPQEFIDDTAFYRADEVINDGSEMPAFDQKPSEYIYASDLIGTDLSDERWDVLLSEMSLTSITRLVRMGGYATVPVDAIGLPGTTDKDGPSGFSSSLIPGRSGMAYPAEIVLASTWNQPLIEEIGKLIGEDSLSLEITGWYAPGANIHRSPYSGRNFEYFSEDSFLSGKAAASIVKGARSKGVITYMKHYALNDQESNRSGGAYFANEQSIREIYLEPFEYAVIEGGSNAVMAAMNRLGARWAGAHKGLMTETLRNEWGFEGMAITDQASVSAMLYEDMISGVFAGTDMWLNTNSSLWSLDEYKDNPTVMTNVVKAAKHIVYAIAHSNAMNGISPDTQVVSIMPWWQKVLWALSAIIWSINLFIIVKFILRFKVSKQK